MVIGRVIRDCVGDRYESSFYARVVRLTLALTGFRAFEADEQITRTDYHA